MATTEKNILFKLYAIAAAMFVFAIAITGKMLSIQVSDGAHYRALANERNVKNDTIQANRGNIYADDGSLLATSISKYDIRFDAVTVKQSTFDKHIKALSDSLAIMLGKNSRYYQQKLKRARKNKKRYELIARNLRYSDYKRIKGFPLFNLGAYKGGLIIEQRTVREHPIGKIARRTIGYERSDGQGNYTRPGIEGGYIDYLKGVNGHRLKQKIAKGQWKPINDENEVEPQDGYDLITTINVNIQDIAYHALLEQLKAYEADHGTVIVMETKTGEVKAMANLGKASNDTYYERLIYGVGESHEPGSTFKLMAMVAALEDKVIDTSYVVDTSGGVMTFFGKYKVVDSKRGGYGKISAARAFEVSSNVGLVKIINNHYKNNPKRFVESLYKMNLNDKLGLKIKGEGSPKIPHPDQKDWSGISLPWMAYGYGVALTPLQTLTFYNAIANNGEMVRPRFVKEIRSWDKPVEVFDKDVINPKICSQETIDKVKEMMKNVVVRGTASNLYSKDFSMAGKTGTCQTNYSQGKSEVEYVASFSGYFPADNPKYSCIVVIHKPNKQKGYYGADVAGPVFKKIAQKIYKDAPIIDEVELNGIAQVEEKNYAVYSELMGQKKVPSVVGMTAMDAIALLENLGLKVVIKGEGIVKRQSLKKGEAIDRNKTIVLELS